MAMVVGPSGSSTQHRTQTALAGGVFFGVLAVFIARGGPDALPPAARPRRPGRVPGAG